jgi:hypothetical protein
MQRFIVVVTVAAAAAYLVRELYRFFSPRRKASGCSHCAAAEEPKPEAEAKEREAS